MLPKICSIPECGRKHYSQDLCQFHLMRKKRYGDPLSEQAELDLICTIDGCGRATSSGGRGWCGMHWKRWRRYGNTSDHIPHYEATEEAYEARTVRVGDCIEWTGSTTRNGYGRFHRDGGIKLVHRYVYERENGPIPEGMYVDHICHNPSCSNIKHLRLATPGQNLQNHQGATVISKTGVRGVYPAKGGRFYAQVTHKYKTYTVGSFGTIEDAEIAVIAKRNELHTHNNRDRV